MNKAQEVAQEINDLVLKKLGKKDTVIFGNDKREIES
jgi:hypothetical protein